MVFFFRRTSLKKTSGKVVVFGATSLVGQPLSLLLKICPHVEELYCYGSFKDEDSKKGKITARGVAVDLSHIDTSTKVKSVDDPNDWELGLRGANLVLICTGNFFDPLRTNRDIALASSASEFMIMMDAIAKIAPKAIIGIISSPVNALVPIAKEVLVRHGVFDPRKLFGITTLDVIRARVLVAQELQMNPYDVNVPVVGGRGGITACPLIAQTGLRIPHERIMWISEQLQSYGIPFSDENCNNNINNILEKQEDKELCLNMTPQVGLSLSYAALEWSVSILKALRGDRGITECTFVESTVRKETPFFSLRVELGEEGVSQLLPMGPLTSYEEELVEAAVPCIAEDVEMGLRFITRKN